MAFGMLPVLSPLHVHTCTSLFIGLPFLFFFPYLNFVFSIVLLASPFIPTLYLVFLLCFFSSSAELQVSYTPKYKLNHINAINRNKAAVCLIRLTALIKYFKYGYFVRIQCLAA